MGRWVILVMWWMMGGGWRSSGDLFCLFCVLGGCDG